MISGNIFVMLYISLRQLIMNINETNKEQQKARSARQAPIEKKKKKARTEQETAILSIVRDNVEVLYSKRESLLSIDDYGNIDDSKWKEELNSFIRNSIRGKLGSRLLFTKTELHDLIEGELDQLE